MQHDDIGQFIQLRHETGDSIMQTIKAVRAQYGVSLGAAKRLVSEHPVWRDLADQSAELHEEAMRAVECVAAENPHPPGHD